jgi:6-phosphogluconolactonase (cycloisomerase 2 family)
MRRARTRQAGWAGLFLAVVPFLTGCGDFWQAPSGSSTSFTLTNSGNITATAGATSGNTSTITVTPSDSFTGTVDLACTVSGPTGATSPVTCSLSPTSVDITSTSAMTATLTATAASTTTAGAYTITVTGSSSGVSASTTVCASVGATSGTCTSTANTSGIFYVLSSSSIAGYTINSGSLTGVTGGSFTNLSQASAITIAPSGAFLYVASGTGITPYTISSSGALAQGTAFGDTVAKALQIDPSGTWLLDASLDGTLKAYPITSTGALANQTLPQPTQLASTGGITTVEQMAISPNGALISVALGGTGTQSFPFNASNTSAPIGSAFTFGSSPASVPYGAAGAAIAVAIDPQSRLLYVGETAAFPNSTSNSGALRVFTIGATSLTELAYTAPYAPLGTGPHAILPDPTGSYVYVASWQTLLPGAITGYSVATSALTQIGSSTVATGTGPASLAEDSTHSYVLALSSQASPLFNAYTFDPTTLGQLDPASVTGSPAASDPIAIVAMPLVQ